MKKLATLGLAIFLLHTANVKAAVNVDKPKSKKSTDYANVNSEIKEVLDAHDFGDIKNSNGNVYIKYYVDQNNVLHINQIGSGSEELKKYVFKSLEGRQVNTSNIEVNKENLVKLNFSLTSN